MAEAERIRAAHAAIRADDTIQFALPEKIRPPAPETPEWLRALGRAIERLVQAVGDGWAWIGYGLIALLAIILLFVLVPPLREWATELLGRRRIAPAAPTWSPQAPQARALLAEADALAGQGSYDAALRLILHRSIEDIDAWRGGIVRPSRTARDIAGAAALPAEARAIFARLAGVVERSWFGGAPAGADDWRRARDDYARFALGSP